MDTSLYKCALVTGGAGFIGCHLVEYLINKTDTYIKILDNLHRGDLDKVRCLESSGRIQFVRGDIRDVDTVNRVTTGCDAVFHLAAQSNVIGSNRNLDYSFSTNVVGTYNVLKAALKAGVERFVFASSREVYGNPEEVPVKEDNPLRAQNAYGASKITGEQYCGVFRENYGLDARILRIANAYGPGDHDRVIPLFCEGLRDNTGMTVYGGNQLLDFVWIQDVVKAFFEAGQIKEWPGPVNVGSGHGLTILELAELLRRLSKRSDVKVKVAPSRPIEVTRFVADVSRMREVFGWAPLNSLSDRLREMLEDYGITLVPRKSMELKI